MAIESTKIIEILDSGKLRETVVNHNENGSALAEAPYPKDLYGNPTIDPLKVNRKLHEAATGGLAVANFPDTLRTGVQFDVFSGYNERPVVYPQLVRTMRSTEHQEEYADDEGIGLPPIVAEGQEYPSVSPTMGGGKIIKNYKRGFVIDVTEELMRFDKWGKVRDTANNVGRAMRMGREQEVMNVLTTTTNYNVLNNNDQAGNNYQTLTFSPIALNAAIALMMTQKDRKSGQYLGVVPSVLLTTPLMERFVRSLLNSQQLMRVGSAAATSDVYGTGTNNPFYGIVSTVVISPLFGASYQWALLDPSRAVYFQEVEGIQVLTEAGNMTSESWLRRDVIRYKARDWYGVGMRDDRFAFYSDSTTAPLAN